MATKKKKIEHFTKKTRHYLGYFGLMDWAVAIESTEKKDVKGTCYFNTEAKLATICYGKDWINEKGATLKEIERTAFHECAELFLSKTRRDITHYEGHSEADEQIHRIIRLLENKILGVYTR